MLQFNALEQLVDTGVYTRRQVGHVTTPGPGRSRDVGSTIATERCRQIWDECRERCCNWTTPRHRHGIITRPAYEHNS